RETWTIRSWGAAIEAFSQRVCSFHHWGLGFRQYSFRLITRALRDGTVNAFGFLPLLWHALFPSGFRLQVNPMAQKRPSDFLLTVSGIQHCVPRRTVALHTAQADHYHPCSPRPCRAWIAVSPRGPFAGPLLGRI